MGKSNSLSEESVPVFGFLQNFYKKLEINSEL